MAAALLARTVTLVHAQNVLSTVGGRVVLEIGARAGTQLSLPTDVAVGPKGQVYAVDSGRHRVSMYDAAGQPLGHFGGAGKGDGQLQGRWASAWRATAACTWPTRTTSASCARRRARRRRAARQGEAAGEFQYPATLAIDGSGRVLVVDVLNYRMQVFDAAGKSLLQFDAQGAKPGDFYRPKGIAVDRRGRILVSDSYLGMVQAFGADGQYLGVLGSGGEPARLQAPTGLALSDGRLFVTDMLAGKIVAYELEASP